MTRRVERLELRLSEEEKAALQRRADEGGVSLSEFVRMSALNTFDAPETVIRKTPIGDIGYATEGPVTAIFKNRGK